MIAPIDGTPAARAGIKPGDVIIKINGKLTDGMSLKDVVDALRGPAGNAVELTIARRGTNPFDVRLARAIIHVASVKWRLEPGHVGYARVTTFADKTEAELLDAIERMERGAGGRLNGFVLDLRNDPGGLLDQAVEVAGDFLDGGIVVSTRGRDAEDNHIYRARRAGDRLNGVPMVVLINGASASASEIVAGALQDRHRATLLGTRSFGKGSVQTIIPLDGHGALRLTTARYYTPSGRSIQAHGIEPDLVVEAPKSELTAAAETLREADLRGALDTGTATAAKSDGAAPATGSERATAAADESGSIDPTLIGTAKDTQLARALVALRALGPDPRVTRNAAQPRTR
ncbi:MAG: S41 family peptidase [Stellaceae bacterium]